MAVHFGVATEDKRHRHGNFMLVPSTPNVMTTTDSTYLFLSLCLSPSSCCSLWCRRLCRAVGVTLGDGGHGVNSQSSELWSPKVFTSKRCCSTAERIVLSRKLKDQGKKKTKFDKKFSTLWSNKNFRNDLQINSLITRPQHWQYHTVFHATIVTVIKSTYFTTSGLQRTGERWLLKEQQEGKVS